MILPPIKLTPEKIKCNIRYITVIDGMTEITLISHAPNILIKKIRTKQQQQLYNRFH